MSDAGDLPKATPERLAPGLWPSLRAGFLAGSPLLLGIVPFGVIYGATASSAGLTLPQSVSMSLAVFAGSAQLFFVNLWAAKVAAPILVLTCLALNLRLLIYGASIGLKLGPPSSYPIALLRSYILTDESYAVSTVAFLKPNFKYQKVFFFVGSGLPTWLGWQTTCVMGYLLGSIIPASWPLSLAVPLLFLSLLISILRAGGEKASPKVVSAAVAGLSAIALGFIPLNLGLILAIALGVAAGLITEAKTDKKADRKADKNIDDKGANKADQQTNDKTDRKATKNIDHKGANKADRQTDKQTNDKTDRKATKNIDHKGANKADNQTNDKTDRKSPAL